MLPVMAEPTTAALSRRGVSVTLSVSADQRHLGLLRDMTTRLAAYAGAEEPDAARLGDAVDRAVGWLLPYLEEEPVGTTIEVQYASTREDISARVQCRRTRVEQDPIESALTQSRMATLGDLVDRVDVGRDGGAAFCRLTSHLPSSKR
jgi:hypothetical protein